MRQWIGIDLFERVGISIAQRKTNLFKPFLENRTQCVKLGIDLSDKLTINHGVPQGTVLGPLIFCYMSTTFLKSGKVKMMLFNLRMTLVLYANLNVMKIFPKKLKKY